MTPGLERLWAGWRSSYMDSITGEEAEQDECVFCAIFNGDRSDEETRLLWRGRRCAAVLNAFPYTSGHLMVMPTRHVGELAEVGGEERAEMWDAVHAAVAALEAAYHPEGVNVGVNLGAAAGAGVPGHLHVHVLPRWNGDTNFMTTVAEVRVLPEPLASTWEKLRSAWPPNDGDGGGDGDGGDRDRQAGQG